MSVDSSCLIFTILPSTLHVHASKRWARNRQRVSVANVDNLTIIVIWLFGDGCVTCLEMPFVIKGDIILTFPDAKNCKRKLTIALHQSALISSFYSCCETKYSIVSLKWIASRNIHTTTFVIISIYFAPETLN